MARVKFRPSVIYASFVCKEDYPQRLRETEIVWRTTAIGWRTAPSVGLQANRWSFATRFSLRKNAVDNRLYSVTTSMLTIESGINSRTARHVLAFSTAFFYRWNYVAPISHFLAANGWSFATRFPLSIICLMPRMSEKALDVLDTNLSCSILYL